MRITSSAVLVACVLAGGCIDQPEGDDESSGGAGKADGAGLVRYEFSGRFQFVRSLLYQSGELRGSFLLGDRDPRTRESRAHDFTYTISLEPSTLGHPAAVITSSSTGDISWASWDRDTLRFSLNEEAVLDATALRTVFGEYTTSTSIVSRLLPYCTLEVTDCKIGAISGFEYVDESSGINPPIRLAPLGPFQLTRKP
jgi:hypothetical protein